MHWYMCGVFSAWELVGGTGAGRDCVAGAREAFRPEYGGGEPDTVPAGARIRAGCGS